MQTTPYKARISSGPIYRFRCGPPTAAVLVLRSGSVIVAVEIMMHLGPLAGQAKDATCRNAVTGLWDMLVPAEIPRRPQEFGVSAGCCLGVGSFQGARWRRPGSVSVTVTSAAKGGSSSMGGVLDSHSIVRRSGLWKAESKRPRHLSFRGQATKGQ